jgi:mRNA interferase MazF
MKVARGEVVLVDYLFSDRTDSKVRPCLVIQADALNTRLDDTILAVISSNTARGVNEPSQFLIDVNTSDGALSGLLFNSAVQCENLATVDCRFIRRKIGSLTPGLMSQVELCLKAALEILP